MGRLAKQINADIAALERGDAAITESPIGDRGEPRPPAAVEPLVPVYVPPTCPRLSLDVHR